MCLNCLKAALTFGCRGNCFNVELYSSDFSLCSVMVHAFLGMGTVSVRNCFKVV